MHVYKGNILIFLLAGILVTSQYIFGPCFANRPLNSLIKPEGCSFPCSVPELRISLSFYFVFSGLLELVHARFVQHGLSSFNLCYRTLHVAMS